MSLASWAAYQLNHDCSHVIFALDNFDLHDAGKIENKILAVLLEIQFIIE